MATLVRSRSGNRFAWSSSRLLHGVAILAALAWLPAPAARADDEAPAPLKTDPELLAPAAMQELYRMYSESRRGRTGPTAVPDIFGHGAVLNVGKVVQKVTNFGYNGNFYTNLSSDPSGQWPGQSGVEYLFIQTIGIGGVNPLVSEGDPVSRRRVSFFNEWRPPSLAPEDHIYPAYEGIVNGKRFFNDDGDKNPNEPLDYLQDKVDEDFLDGRDNDGDGAVDEDYGAVGQQMFSLVMRDDTPEAIRFTQGPEPHVPVGLEIRERAWAYSLTALENFNVFEYQITNVSGHEVDSLFVGFYTDMDAGPVIVSNYFDDDLDVPQFPSGQFWYKLPDVSDAQEPRLQKSHDPDIPNIEPGRPLCTQVGVRVNGFTFGDDNGDDGKTPGMPSFLLFDHTTDPLGVSGPSRVGFRAYRSYGRGTTYSQGGGPRIDQERFELMSSHEGIDPETGFINAASGEQKGDFRAWCSVGPWLHVQPNASVTVTVGFAIQRGTYAQAVQFPADYAALKADSSTDYQAKQTALLSRYPVAKNAFDAQLAFEGVWEARRAGLPSTDWHGRETGIRGAHGSAPNYELQDCRDRAGEGEFRPVLPDQYTWFDFDCDYCTGVWSYAVGGPQPLDRKYLGGFFHKTWNASAPPPSPVLNSSTGYNFTDNPARVVAAAGDNRITLAWDNTSQISTDPGEIRGVKSIFDFRGYKIYKVAGWARPVGSSGPAEDEWSLVAEFACFDYRDSLGRRIESNQVRMDGSTPVYPKVWIPQKQESLTIELHRGDLWDRQSGHVLRPDSAIGCVRSAGDPCDVGACEAKCGRSVFPPFQEEKPIHYPVGFYRFEDDEVRNGFLYFYSVTAYDSSFDGMTEGRKSAVESEGVTPQAATKAGQAVWVVPNPYKGRQRIAERPSTWDLTPNATDPTGTHIDFMGLPPGRWTIRIYTVAGDLVREIRSTDAVNESLRGPVTTPGGVLPGFNRQQDTANDGQASWNLISRNGQDIATGVYLFTVDSSTGLQRGRFVVIR
jgi:hypothetical protein